MVICLYVLYSMCCCFVVGLEEEVLVSNCKKYKGTFVLRVCGLDEYLLRQCPISQYKVGRPHIHSTVSRYQRAQHLMGTILLKF